MYTPINRKSIVESCVSAMANSEDPVHRRLSLLILRLISSNYTENGGMLFDAAEKALKEDSSAEVRRLAAWVLGDFPVDASLKTLIKALADENWEVRFEVVEAMAIIAEMNIYDDDNDDNDNDDDEEDNSDDKDDNDAIAGLLQALGDKQPKVSLRAAYHLSQLHPSKVRSAIKKMIPECAEVIY